MAVDISDKLLKQGYIQNATSDNQDATTSDSGIYKDMNAQQTLPDGIEMDNKGTIKGDLGYKANAEGWLNTGTGTAAATWENNGKVEGGYSWDQKGASQASKQYQMDAMTQLQENLKQRQSIEEQIGVQQQAADMLQYKNAQDAEKLGWTGGYVLDQNTKMDYMKASIAAQMYSAIELNKYAQDVGLAAARLSYELNQQEYADKYYQEAQQTAFNEAQTTGTYFSAEVKDMMGQYSAAQKALDDPSASEADKQRAQLIQKSIVDWFGTNKISPNGVKEVSFWNSEVNNTLSLSRELFTRYQSALEVANTKEKDSTTTFVVVDRDGNPVYDNGSVQTIDMSVATPDQILEYLVDADGNHNVQAQSQMYSYLNWMIRDVLDKHDTEDSPDYSILQNDLDNTVNKRFKELQDAANNVDDTNLKTTLTSILENYSFNGSYNKIDPSKLTLPNYKPTSGGQGGQGGSLIPSTVAVENRTNDDRLSYEKGDIKIPDDPEVMQTAENFEGYFNKTTIPTSMDLKLEIDGTTYTFEPEYFYTNSNPVVDQSKGKTQVQKHDVAVVNVEGNDKICIAEHVKGDDADTLRWIVLDWEVAGEDNTGNTGAQGSYNQLVQQLKDKGAYGVAQSVKTQPTSITEDTPYTFTIQHSSYSLGQDVTFVITNQADKTTTTITAKQKVYASNAINKQLKNAGYKAIDNKGNIVKAQDGSYYLSDGSSWIMLSGVTNGDLLMKAAKR